MALVPANTLSHRTLVAGTDAAFSLSLRTEDDPCRTPLILVRWRAAGVSRLMQFLRRPNDASAGSRRPLAPADSAPSLPLRPGVLCLQQWLDLNA